MSSREFAFTVQKFIPVKSGPLIFFIEYKTGCRLSRFRLARPISDSFRARFEPCFRTLFANRTSFFEDYFSGWDSAIARSNLLARRDAPELPNIEYSICWLFRSRGLLPSPRFRFVLQLLPALRFLLLASFMDYSPSPSI